VFRNGFFHFFNCKGLLQLKYIFTWSLPKMSSVYFLCCQFFCLAFPKALVGQRFLSFKLKILSWWKLLEGHLCLELLLVYRKSVSNPQSRFSANICTIPEILQACTSPALLGSEAMTVLELAGRSNVNDFSLSPSRQLLFIFAVVREVNVWFQLQIL